jgi:succinyl-diaminopimelate desuccinylase
MGREMKADFLKIIKQHVDRQELLKILFELIRIPSENPPGDESEMSRVVAKWLKKYGCAIETYSAKEKRINVLASKTWGLPGRTLIWCGHMDVVPAGDVRLWRRPPFDPRRVGDRIFGRGTVDMKGAIAAAIEAIAALARARIKLHGKVKFLLSADEETSSVLGVDYLSSAGIIHEKSGDAAIVGEPTGLNVLIAEKGYLWCRISTVGKPAHGSKPEFGINAIEKMSKIVAKLNSLKLKGHHPILGRPTINIGTISGGTKINIVPDACTISIDRRKIPHEVDAQVIQEFKTAIEEIAKRDKDLRANIEVYDRADASEIQPDEEIVRLARKSVRRVTGRSVHLDGLSGASDARFLINRCKIPTIICGPGSLKQAHTANEYVTASQLISASRSYALMFTEFLR